VTAAFILLGERLDARQWIGAAIVLAAVWVIVWRSARTADATAVTAT